MANMTSKVTKREEINWKIVFTEVEYCDICKSTNIKTSREWRKYCWDICWKNQKHKRQMEKWDIWDIEY